MKGLLYKEFRLSLPNMIVYGTVQLVLTVMSIVMAVLSKGNETDINNLYMMFVFSDIAMFFLFSLMPLTTFSCDATHAWQNFSASAPTGSAGQVGSKYIVTLISYIFLFIIHTLQFIAASLITDSNFYFMIIVEVFLMSIFFILTSFEFPFFFAFGFEKGQLVKGSSILAFLFIGAVYLFFGNISIFDTPNPLMTVLAYMNVSAIIFVPIAIVIAALPLFCLSMMISIKLFSIGLENLEQ